MGKQSFMPTTRIEGIAAVLCKLNNFDVSLRSSYESKKLLHREMEIRGCTPNFVLVGKFSSVVVLIGRWFAGIRFSLKDTVSFTAVMRFTSILGLD